MILNQILNYGLGAAIVAIVGYVVFLRVNNRKLEKEIFEEQTKGELDDAKKDAYSTPLDDLVNQSNKKLPGRIKRDK